MNVDVSQLAALQCKTDRIRNICILAHVDHGKTTLSDHLIASNGLIHPKLVGEMRYLDSRDDEQARGITMKSSSISLLYIPGASALPRPSAAEQLERGHLVNLIDSPGHVDFCSEVSSAARLSDGALVVVDAVEGVCIQTHAVLRQAWEEKVATCLVINKVDRLILEWRLSPAEAYERLKGIIAHVNMILSAFASERWMSEADAVLAHEDARASLDTSSRDSNGQAAADGDDQQDAFSPDKGNVAFCSAYDGWGFRTSQFAAIYAEKLGCNTKALEKALWGDYAYQAKTKRIVRIKREEAHRQKPLFVQLALEPLWKAYTALDQGSPHKEVLGKMVKGLGLEGAVSERALAHPDARTALRTVLRAWLPLSEAVLGMSIDQLPSPLDAGPVRLPRLLPPQEVHLKGAVLPLGVQAQLDATEAAMKACSTSPDVPLVIYVSKMVAVPAAALPRRPGEPAPEGEEQFLAFGRVFSGVVREGQAVQVLSAAYNPAEPHRQRQELTVQALYLMMGRGLERLQEVPAGNVLAMRGLATAILKSATLTSSPAARPLAPMLFQAAPIVRVAVEPAVPAEMPRLVQGLRLLNQADPFVEVTLQDSGEHVLGAAGEVHLETCIKDLQERFARIKLQVSPPLTAFRETVFCPGEASEINGKPAKVVEAVTANGQCRLRVRALPLNARVAAALDESAAALRSALAGDRDTNSAGTASDAHHQQAAEAVNGGGFSLPPSAAESDSDRMEVATASNALTPLRNRLLEAVKDTADAVLLARAWLLGPKRVGPNLLLTRSASSAAGRGGTGSLWDVPAAAVVHITKRPGAHLDEPSQIGDSGDGPAEAEARFVTLELGNDEAAQTLGLASSSIQKLSTAHPADTIANNSDSNGTASHDEERSGQQAAVAAAGGLRHSVETGVAAGFQLATAAGPLCDEPLWGVAFEVEARLQPGAGAAAVALAEEVYGPFSGQVTAAARQAMRRALLEADPRLVEAMFLCEVSMSSEALSGVYAVLGRRRARVLREEMREGSDLFTVHAFLPAQASFGFAGELRARSSGAASASLLLSHWERLQVDPFFVPTTEEEREEFGEEGQGVGAPNLAKVLIDTVRRRKGLPVEEKVVEAATKQRTRARKV